jgi:hypothetical protein
VPLQNVSTTIATLIAFPVNVIELGTILQVMLITGLVQVSSTVPVVPGKAVRTNPNTALLPGVVVTVEVLPCPIPIVTGLLPLLNVAVTAVAALNVTMQVPVPAQPPPLQPAKVELADADAVNFTCVPLAKFAEQVVGQLIPAGALVTVPVPVPASITDNAKPLVLELKVAVTVVAAFNVTTQVPVPVQPPPLHPANVEPSAGLAINVTCAPLAKFAEHFAEHALMPAGLLLTAPDPVPANITVRVSLLPVLKVAVTVTSVVPIGTVHVGGFVCGFAGTQFVLKPANVDPSAAVAVNITLLLSGKAARQLDGQLIPLGELVTVPVPVPISVTIRLFVPTSFSPNIANPDAALTPFVSGGVVKVISCVPSAIVNLKIFPVSKSAVQNVVPSGSRFKANSAAADGFGV